MGGTDYTIVNLLTHASIIVAAYAILATGTRDLFEDKVVHGGIPPRELRVPLLESESASSLRKTVKWIVHRIFWMYAVIAVMVLVAEALPPGYPISVGIGSWKPQWEYQKMVFSIGTTFHLIIVMTIAGLIGRLIWVRDIEARIRWRA